VSTQFARQAPSSTTRAARGTFRKCQLSNRSNRFQQPDYGQAIDIPGCNRVVIHALAGQRGPDEIRHFLVAQLARVALQAAFAEISGPGAPRAEVAYRPSGGLDLSGDEADLAGRYEEALAARLSRDLERGYTTCGPHMDDLLLAIGGRAARAYGSQGQQRAYVLSLRIAEIENLRAVLARPPLLLLDDVSSELDPAKNAFLLAYVASLPAQAFLTSTDRRLIEPAAGPETRFFRVASGAISPLVS